MALPDLSGRAAVITGASRGLGAGLARAFAARGLRLGLLARTDPVLPPGPRVWAERLDVRDADALEGFAARAAAYLGPVDLWVNNAGVIEPIGPLAETDPAAFRQHLEINLVGVFHGTRAYVRQRRALGPGGVLVNVTSGAAQRAYAGWSAYCAAKAAVERLTEVVALEEAKHGLRAHAVAPGVIDTDMQAAIRACAPDRFPDVARFHDLKRRDAYNTPEFVAGHLLEIAFDPARPPDPVVLRLPDESQS